MTKAYLLIAIASSTVLAAPADDLFDWATITDAGNRGYDRATINDALIGRGAVNYDYRIARNEVTTAQYLAFLNTFTTQSDALADRLRPPIHWGGERDISYVGPGTRYTLRVDVADAANLPLLGVSWHEAAYFVNWMNNDLSTDPSAIENGAYDASQFDFDPAGGFDDPDSRNPDARYFLPTWDEALKANHWDPNKFGDGKGGWWIYNDGSDTQPVGGPPGEGETSAHWIDDMFGGRPAWETPLGAYEETTTPWGLLDASGGGAEWTESWTQPPDFPINVARYIMGNPAGRLGDSDSAAFTGGEWPTTRGRLTSFRVGAIVPAPSAPVIVVGPLLTLTQRKRT